MLKRKLFLSVGPFDTSMKAGEFIDWFLRAKEKGLNITHLTDTILKRRVHAGNSARAKEMMRGEYLKVVRASLARKKNLEAPKKDND